MCTKCRIDNGFIAEAATSLADSVGQGHDLYKPAFLLASAARGYVATAEHADRAFGSPPDQPAGRRGSCHRAVKIMAWVLDENGRVDSASAIAEMQAWRVDILRETANLMSGTQGEHAHGEG